jgi:hypothetical protein
MGKQKCRVRGDSDVECRVRRCVVVTQQPVFLVAKVRVEGFAHFDAVIVERHGSMQNWLFGLPARILWEQSPWCQRKLWACSWLCSSAVSPFRSWRVLTLRVRLMLSSPHACLIISRVSATLFLSFAQNSMLLLCRTNRQATYTTLYKCDSCKVQTEFLYML